MMLQAQSFTTFHLTTAAHFNEKSQLGNNLPHEGIVDPLIFHIKIFVLKFPVPFFCTTW